jgi:ribosome-interacting GTPase 1
MPTNLPPDYYRVEKQYREASSPREKISLLEEMISIAPKHKGTEKLLGDLRRRLSRLKEAAQTRKSVSRKESAFHVEREGAGTVAVIGLANVGKSALVAALTNATPEVADYPYTTWTPTPGMMPVKGVQVQLIDTPPLNDDYVEPELWELIRRSDLILMMIDIQGYPIEQFEKSLAILKSGRIVPVGHHGQEGERNRATTIPFIMVVNKVDDESVMEDFEVLCELLAPDWNLLPLSVKERHNFDRLKDIVFDQLGIIRVYARPPGTEPDLSTPYVMEKGATVEAFASKVHKDFYEKLKSARVWGSGVFDGQLVGRDHVLKDGDIVELRI